MISSNDEMYTSTNPKKPRKKRPLTDYNQIIWSELDSAKCRQDYYFFSGAYIKAEGNHVQIDCYWNTGNLDTKKKNIYS